MAGLVGIYHLFELTASRIFGTGKAIVRKYLLKYNRSLVLILFVCRRSFFPRTSDINVWYYKYDFRYVFFRISLDKVMFCQTQYKG